MYGPPGTRPVPPSASTAKTLILIALIFQIIGSVVIVLFAWAIAGFLAIAGLGGFGAVLFVIGLLVIVVAYLAYAYAYRPTAEGRYEDARTPTLVFGIVGLFAGGIIIGILYLVAWDKLGDAIREQQFPVMAPMGYMPVAVPMTPAGTAYATPTYPAAPPAAPALACPRCHNAASWVAQYNRYYCYHCQQYV